MKIKNHHIIWFGEPADWMKKLKCGNVVCMSRIKEERQRLQGASLPAFTGFIRRNEIPGKRGVMK